MTYNNETLVRHSAFASDIRIPFKLGIDSLRLATSKTSSYQVRKSNSFRSIVYLAYSLAVKIAESFSRIFHSSYSSRQRDTKHKSDPMMTMMNMKKLVSLGLLLLLNLAPTVIGALTNLRSSHDIVKTAEAEPVKVLLLTEALWCVRTVVHIS